MVEILLFYEFPTYIPLKPVGVGLEYSSLLEHLPSMYKYLDLSLSMGKENQNGNKTVHSFYIH
jgi:hypothetical protein